MIRVLALTGEKIESLGVRFVPVGGGFNGPIVAKRGHVYVVDEGRESPQNVLCFVGVSPMNVHYTSTPSGACSSGYTEDDAGEYPGCSHRADSTVVPARVFELAMLKYDDEWGITHRNFSDEAAAYAADWYRESEGDFVPEYDPPCCE